MPVKQGSHFSWPEGRVESGEMGPKKTKVKCSPDVLPVTWRRAGMTDWTRERLLRLTQRLLLLRVSERAHDDNPCEIVHAILEAFFACCSEQLQ